MRDPRRIGPLRYLAASKPRMDRPPISFFRCSDCGNVIRTTVSENKTVELLCDGHCMERLIPKNTESLPEGSELHYDIVGGQNENCIRVFWSGKRPTWLYLETFTGGQHMVIKENKRPPAVFALAGEDAYAYCDKDPCEMCSFRCKNGFVLYAWYENDELYSVEINRIAATPGSSESTTRTQQHSQ